MHICLNAQQYKIPDVLLDYFKDVPYSRKFSRVLMFVDWSLRKFRGLIFTDSKIPKPCPKVFSCCRYLIAEAITEVAIIPERVPLGSTRFSGILQQQYSPTNKLQ